ncbi:MAG: hypothetical protein WDZ41_01160 [Candidatus Babeliales bacterium]
MRLVKFFLLVGIFYSGLSANSDTKNNNDNAKHNRRVNTLVGAHLLAAIPANQQSSSYDLYYDFPGSSPFAFGNQKIDKKINYSEYLAPYHIDFP